MTADNLPQTAPAPDGIDYDEVEAAVMESERGRWFLEEFARRHRHAETERLLDAISRIESNIAARPAGDADPETIGLRRAICEMAEQIAAAKREIAAIRPAEGESCEISGATAELDAIVTAAESATSQILSAAEQIQELAWTLREQGAPSEFCDALDERATEIYTACSFQDITGQRTTKVVRVLQLLEARISAMAELWSFERQEARAPAPDSAEVNDGLLNGPAMDGEGSSQDAVDRMMAEAHGDDGAAEDSDEGPGEIEQRFAAALEEAAVREAETDDGPAAVATDDAPAKSGDGASDGQGGHDAAIAEADAGPDLSQLSEKDYEALFT